MMRCRSDCRTQVRKWQSMMQVITEQQKKAWFKIRSGLNLQKMKTSGGLCVLSGA